MAEPMKKDAPASREVGIGEDRRFARDEDTLEAELALDDTGVEDDDDGLDEPAVRFGARTRSSGVAPKARDAAAPRPGSLIAGKYRVERVLEENGPVVVLQALHVGLEQLVTVKCLLPSHSVRPDAVTRFLRSARTAVQIQSEHAARIIDVGRMRSGAPFIVTEELSGWELDEVLRVRGPLPVQEAVEYVVQACEAVAEAHGLGIVHGALNLENVVLTRRTDDSPLVKVLGFGAALPDEIPLGDDPTALAHASGFMTVLPYLAPEQIRSADSVDERMDVWAIGALLHTLLSGAPPFRAKNALALLAVVSADTPRRLSEVRDDIAPELDATVVRCLDKDPGSRFANMAELVLALKPFAPGDSQGAVERISKMYGRATRPPPLPVPGRAIVHVASKPKPQVPPVTPPVHAAGQPPASKWLFVAAAGGAAIGAVCAAITVVSVSPLLHAAPVAESVPFAYAPYPYPTAPAAPAVVPAPAAPTPTAAAVAAAPTAAAAVPKAPLLAAVPRVAAVPRPVVPASVPVAAARKLEPASAKPVTEEPRTGARTASAGADLFGDTK